MKKFILTFIMLALGVLIGHPITVDGVNYSISGGEATVTGASSTSITRVVIPATVTTGGKTYPVTHMSGTAFKNFRSLHEVVIEDSSEPLLTDDITVNAISNIGNPFEGCPIESYYIGRNFSRNPSSNKYTMPLQVVSTAPSYEVTVGGEATFIPGIFSFVGRTNLTSITLGPKVKDVYSKAFEGCTSLRKLTIEPGDEDLNIQNNNSFDTCPLDTIVMGRSMNYAIVLQESKGNTPRYVRFPAGCKTRIQGFQFKDCNIEEVYIENSPELFDVYEVIFQECNIDRVYYGRPINAGVTAIKNSSRIRHITFGPCVTDIHSGYGSEQPELESVDFKGDTAYLNLSAFEKCPKLKSVRLPSGTKEIGTYAFYESGLQEIILPEGLERIGISAFTRTPLRSVTLPVSLTMIEQYAFEGCGSLKTVRIEDSSTELEFKADGYGNGPFTACDIDSLYIGRNTEANFINGSSVKVLEFGNQVTGLDRTFAFGQKNLRSVLLGENITGIGYSAFEGCDSLMQVTSLAKVPPVCEADYTFSQNTYNNATLFVPTGTKKLYRGAEVWKLFGKIQSADGGFTVTATYDITMGTVKLNGSESSPVSVDEDEPLSIEIIPAEGYTTGTVKVNGEDVTASLADGRLSYTSISSNMEIEVEFIKITFSINVPASTPGGTLLINGKTSELAAVDYGSRLEIKPVPSRGHEITLFTVNGEDCLTNLPADSTVVIEKVTSDIAVDIMFAPIVFTVTASGSGIYGQLILNGEATDSCRVAFGSPLVIKAVPAGEGCYLASLTVDGVEVTDSLRDNEYTIAGVETDMTVEALFAIHTYTVTLDYNSSQGEIVAPDLPMEDGRVTVGHGSDLRLTIIPAEGFELRRLTVDGRDMTASVGTDGTLTLKNVTADIAVSAEFAVRRVRLNILGQGGLVAMRYEYGSEVTLVIEAEEGWEFSTLTVGERIVTELDSDNTFTTDPIMDDTDVSVVFRKAGGTGIDNTAANGSDVKVTASNRTITVLGAMEGSEVVITDVSGITLYRGTDHTISVDRGGIMIVSVEGRSFKLMLR